MKTKFIPSTTSGLGHESDYRYLTGDDSMPDYQRSAKVQASADALFDYLSDINNLPKYFNRMTSARSAGPDEVYSTANVNGKEVEGKAKFNVDKAAKKLQWSSEGPNDYHGELEVTGEGNASQVAVKLHTKSTLKQQIEDGLQKTLDNIVRLVEDSATKAA
jgi:uncharacterized membrane protein